MMIAEFSKEVADPESSTRNFLAVGTDHESPQAVPYIVALCC
jgi:hypothetical protein